ncbi:MAG TPA: hypothetical protein VN944_09920, partial [Nitrospiria bacterium]|nr:hypothetical protein [Nitrospiria bacterium]
MKFEKLNIKGKEKKREGVLFLAFLIFTFHFSLFTYLPAEAAQTATSSQTLQLQSTAFRFDSSQMTAQSDPHHIEQTDGPYH